MRLSETDLLKCRDEFLEKGYRLFEYDRAEMKRATLAEPEWVHFGAGNIFRAFPAAVLDERLSKGGKKGVIAVESFDREVIEKSYRPFDDLSVLVTLNDDGTVEKRVTGSVALAIILEGTHSSGYEKLAGIFAAPSLRAASFTITEKGYAVKGTDDDEKMRQHLMFVLTSLLYERFKAGAYPLALVSLDNCSHNGDRLREAVCHFAGIMLAKGMVSEEFIKYINDRKMISFPLTMIDCITPRPDGKVAKMLEEDGLCDTDIIVTDKNTYTAAFVNAEKSRYLVMEDDFPNKRPDLFGEGIYYTDRKTVDRAERMKVCTCLNPVHTALAIFGCLLGFSAIYEEMKDEDLRRFVTDMAYNEGMPVVSDPGIIDPEEFLEEVLTKRLVNPFMPDSPRRIACDTSQKLPVRFGVALLRYIEKGEDVSKLYYIPAVFAAYLRYLTGIDDNGNEFQISPDPLKDELSSFMSKFRNGRRASEEELMPILCREDIFGVDLKEAGLSGIVAKTFDLLNRQYGNVRAFLANGKGMEK